MSPHHSGLVFPAELSADTLRRAAPSMFAEAPRPGLSSRYAFISTSQVVEVLRAEGWAPVRVREQPVRIEGRRGFQLHQLNFARRDALASGMELNGVRPELVLQNSHDGTRPYRIDAGLYRLICKNGLVVADSTFSRISIRHLDVTAERFIAAARSVAESTPRLASVVQQWREVKLTSAARLDFAQKASALRWEAGDTTAQLLPPAQLLEVTRGGDYGSDLWTTFNVLQEKLLRGGMKYRGIVADASSPTGHRFVRNRVRPVTGLMQGQQLNKDLWSLAATFAQN